MVFFDFLGWRVLYGCGVGGGSSPASTLRSSPRLGTSLYACEREVCGLVRGVGYVAERLCLRGQICAPTAIGKAEICKISITS